MSTVTGQEKEQLSLSTEVVNSTGVGTVGVAGDGVVLVDEPARGEAALQTSTSDTSGVAHIKEKYLVKRKHPDATSADASSNDADAQPPPSKKKKRGQNKHRPRSRIPFSKQLCPSLHIKSRDNNTCSFGDKCRYTHDVSTYMASKPPDLGEKCIVFETFGQCPYSLACRFGSCHLTSDYKNVVNEDVFDSNCPSPTINVLSKTLQERLRKRAVKFPRSEAYLKKLKTTVPAAIKTTVPAAIKTLEPNESCQPSNLQDIRSTDSITAVVTESAKDRSVNNIPSIQDTTESAKDRSVHDIPGSSSVQDTTESPQDRSVHDIPGSSSVQDTAESPQDRSVHDIPGSSSVQDTAESPQDRSVHDIPGSSSVQDTTESPQDRSIHDIPGSSSVQDTTESPQDRSVHDIPGSSSVQDTAESPQDRSVHDIPGSSSVQDTAESPQVLSMVDGISREGVQSTVGENRARSTVVHTSGAVTDGDCVKLRPQEIKQVDFRNKLFLAPLTTVGNLPFRRICKAFGADITCGEMAMCTNLLQGQQSEWALIKRHECEDIFGVQVCGSHADTMTRCAELLSSHASVDFVDINTGCPIDLVFKKAWSQEVLSLAQLGRGLPGTTKLYFQGAGSALMGRQTRFETIVRGMVDVLDCPLTVKMRTGIVNKNWNAHKLVGKLREWGASLVTVHGRSREQRYTRLADWDYLNVCAKASYPMPLFGNGDILSYEDYNLHREQTEVAGIMIARGALIKPWIFTEIKEQRHWDISSSERFDVLRRYANYGLEHWGSDTQGVENTRRFLLEWLSFLYRYIPVGLLERVPQKINERSPYYMGRDDLETLMISNNCQDWIKISEMLLGPVPSNFTFLPKHRANAYSQST